jgi:von Willebrand factor type A domain/Putative metal-binding motif
MTCGRSPSETSIVARRLGKTAALVALSTVVAAGAGHAQTDKPRFVILLDNSTSMTQNLAGTQTHGDGSEAQPGCNLDGKSTAGWPYDDSKFFLAKTAIIDTISAFGAAEFALATYSRTQLGQTCGSDANCTALVSGASCVDVPNDGSSQKYCAYHAGDGYMECSVGPTCTACASPSESNDLVFDWGSFDCLHTTCSFAQGCIGGQVIVGFPSGSTSNLTDIYRWIDGKEDLPPFTATSNRELRAVTMTPLASAIDSVRAWLTDASKTSIGTGAGLLSTTTSARDPRASCRPYNIILITDGEDTCSPNPTTDPVTAAGAAYSAGISVYVVGFGTGVSNVLNNMAMAGSGLTRPAYFPSNRADLTASLGDILMNAIPKPKCSCDATCYDEAAAFPDKGKPCTVGIGRCKRQGVYACNAAGDGVVCANASTCAATPLVAGAPVAEQCGVLSGCLAPTAADCADENCDGNIDEGLSCSCTAKPEVCNGKDDNCDGVVDNIAQVACGLSLGACKAGVTACASDGAGGWQQVCQGQVGPMPELCDGIDNDCNGLVDDIARSCYPDGKPGCSYDATTKAWTCVGACKTGLQACSAGAWQACVGSVTPADEIACDGLDNNCDGRVDENNPSTSDVCYPAGTAGCDAATGKCTGECALGHIACASNKMGLTCAGSHVPIGELCNGKDDDCDGQIDEDFPTLGQPCNEQSCQGAGKFVCNASGTGVVCSVSALGPTPEICDGIDNDCDGQVDEAPGPGDPAMPGVGVLCGSNIGECKQGATICSGGKLVCSSVGATPEVCDGKDNDCNGSIDDGLVPPDTTCNPAGLASGQPLKGECKPGTFVCRGAEGWQCQGGVGPTPEVCDGKDNDCDGQIDNNASCAAGTICISGECVPTCVEGGEQYPCPADRYCKNGACLPKACARTPCTGGNICQADGTCVDPCSLMTCLPGASCVKGVCLDCYSQGCPTGKRCIGRQCTVDPCAGVTCGKDKICNNGSCVSTCAEMTCDTGQVCSQGKCSKSACAQVCDSDSYCDGASGTCLPKRCASINCPAGRVCVNSLAKCIDDPCEKIHCGTGQVCLVADDGTADCSIPVASGIANKAQTSGNGLFSCSVGQLGRGPASGAAATLFVALVLGGSLLRRRRRR